MGRLQFGLGNGPFPRKMFQIPWLSSLAIVTTLIAVSGSPTNINFYKIAFLHTIISQAWLLILHLMQATVGRRTHSARPPPKPDPAPFSTTDSRHQFCQRARQRDSHKKRHLMWSDMLLRISLVYLPVLNMILMELASDSCNVVQGLIVVSIALSWWSFGSALIFSAGHLIDQLADSGRTRRPVPWRFTGYQ